MRDYRMPELEPVDEWLPRRRDRPQLCRRSSGQQRSPRLHSRRFRGGASRIRAS